MRVANRKRYPDEGRTDCRLRPEDSARDLGSRLVAVASEEVTDEGVILRSEGLEVDEVDVEAVVLVGTVVGAIEYFHAPDSPMWRLGVVVAIAMTAALSVGTLIIFAVLSGLVIIGLTLYSAAIDRLRDYGTLKAIGATNGYITRLILSQALLISMVGFAFGRLLVEGFRMGIAQAGTLFHFPPAVQIGFFLLTLIISLGGSLFAIRRINSLEPAQIFRQ